MMNQLFPMLFCITIIIIMFPKRINEYYLSMVGEDQFPQ